MASHFSENLELLFEQSALPTWTAFAEEVGISRATVSKLRNGRKLPARQHLKRLAQYSGLSSAELLADSAEFRLALGKVQPTETTGLQHLERLARQSESIDTIRKAYVGEFNLYTQRNSQDQTFGSHLSIHFAKHLYPEFELLNPFPLGTGRHRTFTYRGVAVFAFDTLYLIGSEANGEAGVMLLSFVKTPMSRALFLQGILSGIGIYQKREHRQLCSVPVVAVRRSRPLHDWRSELGKTLGLVDIATLPEMIAPHLTTDILRMPNFPT